jgi:hypothetical protein
MISMMGPAAPNMLQRVCGRKAATKTKKTFEFQIGQKYPNNMIELRLNSTTLPQVTISPGNLGAAFGGNIAFYAYTPQGQAPYLLTLNVVSSRTLVFSLKLENSSPNTHKIKKAHTHKEIEFLGFALLQ